MKVFFLIMLLNLPFSGLIFSTSNIPENRDMPISYLTKSEIIPDAMQMDPIGRLPFKGHFSCSTVSAANYLVYFMEKGYIPDFLFSNKKNEMVFQVARVLSLKKYFNDNQMGINPKRFVNSLKLYLQDHQIKINSCDYWGWEKISKGLAPPPLWFKNRVYGPKSATWILIGVIKQKEKYYLLKKLHWVSCVGYSGNKKDKEIALVIHCPSPRSGMEFQNEFLRFRCHSSLKIKIPFLEINNVLISSYQIVEGMKWLRANEFGLLLGGASIVL